MNDVSISTSWLESDGTEASVDGGVLIIIWVILLLPLLSLAVMSALVARRNRGNRRTRQTRPRPRSDALCNAEQVRPAMTDLQLVAVETAGSVFVVDGVVVDHDSPLGPVGWPVAFRVRRPQTPGLSEAVRAMLVRWAAEDEIVGFAITGVEPWRRVSITHGTSVLNLDPEPVDGPRS